jgi:hypothetical protein
MDPLTPARRRRRVRPWIVVAAAVALLLLAHSIWDYIEARALKSALAAYAPDYRSEEPIPPVVPPDRDAVPYLAAAAELASRTGEPPIDRALDLNLPADEATNALSPASLDYIARTLGAHADALRLLDVALTRTFVGYPPGRQHRPNVSDLWALKRLVSFRALQAAVQRDGDAAVRSLEAELFLDGSDRSPVALGEPIWLLTGREADTRDIQFVLSASSPGEAALASLDVALAAADDDKLIATYLSQMRDVVVSAELQRLGRYDGSFARAGLFGEGFPDVRPTLADRIERPLRARDLRTQIEGYAAMIAASHQPWPQRLDAIASAGARTMAKPLMDNLNGDFERTAADIACLRATRVTVAIERYRRAHADALPASLDQLVPALLNAVPTDPFSGQALRFRPAAPGYVVYSVGTNRQDDRGDQADGTIKRAPNSMRPISFGDIGVHIAR